MIYDAPSNIKEQLDTYIIGQEHAKWAIANAFFIYQMRMHHLFKGMNVQHKSHVLLTGPTGTGKTYMARCLADVLDVPLIAVDCAALSQGAGWSGESVFDAIGLEGERLGLHGTSMAILLLDEIDKISCTSNNVAGDHAQGVQSSLLSLLDGKTHTSKSTGWNSAQTINPDLFFIIGAGAFPELSKMQNSTKDIKRSLKQLGMKGELLNRFVNISVLEELSLDQLYEILVDAPHSPLMFYREVFGMCGQKLILSDLEEFQIKQQLKEGHARAINSILFDILSPRLQALKPSTLLLNNP